MLNKKSSPFLRIWQPKQRPILAFALRLPLGLNEAYSQLPLRLLAG